MILSILADTPVHQELTSLTSLDGVQIVPTSIDPASFLVLCSDGATLAIRYMACNEVLHAIRQGQLDALMLALHERSPWAYLLIGGVMVPNADGQVRTNTGTTTGWTWDAYQGALMAVQETGVSVLTLQHAQHVPAMISRLAKRDRTPKRVKPLRDVLWSDPATDLLTSLPGIGEEKATTLISYCNTAADALNCLTDDNLPLPKGIGPKTREQARTVLGLAANEALGRYLTSA